MLAPAPMSEQYPYCGICPIIENPSPNELAMRIYEGDHWLLTLRRNNQALLGTSFITLKTHKESLPELSPEEDLEQISIRNRFIGAVVAAFGAETNVNIFCLMNDAYKPTGDPNFRPQPHIHSNFKPRFSGYSDGLRTVADTEFFDPEFGGPLVLRRTQKVELPVGQIIVAAIKAHF